MALLSVPPWGAIAAPRHAITRRAVQTIARVRAVRPVAHWVTVSVTQRPREAQPALTGPTGGVARRVGRALAALKATGTEASGRAGYKQRTSGIQDLNWIDPI